MEIVKIKGNHKNEVIKTSSTDKLRVAAYIRVSTDYDEQSNSYSSQEIYYRNKIIENDNWELVDIYGDEGISGTKTEKRIGFMNLIRDANNEKIDLILTKSISRFARNTIDTIKYVRLLKCKGVAVFFEEEKINTLKVSGEFLLTVLSAIAEQEAYNLSTHVQLGLKMKMMRGENVGFYGCYGYKMIPESKTLEIIPKEAETVKTIFDMYLKGYSFAEISRYLKSKGIKTKNNKDNWSSETLRKMIKNEKYVGDILLGKFANKNTLVKLNNDNLYLVRNHHEPIIDRDTFEKANNFLKNNSNSKYNNAWYGTKEFSGTFKCGFCGKSVTRRNRRKKDKKEYYCTSVIKGYWNDCVNSAPIDEKVIKECFVKAMKKLYRKLEKKLVNDLEDFEYNYVYKILCEYEKENSFNIDFYNKIIKYVIIGGYKDNQPNPYNIRFIIKLEDDIFNYSKYIGKDDILNHDKKKILEFTNNNTFGHYTYDDNYRRHWTTVMNHQVTVEYERISWK